MNTSDGVYAVGVYSVSHSAYVSTFYEQSANHSKDI